MKKIMTILLVTGVLSTVNANSMKTPSSYKFFCNFWIEYPCPSGTITEGCFATYEEAAAALALKPTMLCP